MQLKELLLCVPIGITSLSGCLVNNRTNHEVNELKVSQEIQDEDNHSVSGEFHKEGVEKESLEIRVLRSILDKDLDSRISELADHDLLLRAHAANLRERLKKDVGEAVDYLNFFLRIEEERSEVDGVITYKLGEAHKKNGNLREALMHFARAREIGKRVIVWEISTIEYGRTLLELIETSRLKGDFVNGIGYVRDFLKLEDEVRSMGSKVGFIRSKDIAENERLCLEYAVRYGNVRNHDGAEFYLLMALTNNRNNAKTHSMLAELYYARGNLDEAESELRRVLDLNPNYKRAHANLAIVLRDQGKREEALFNFNKAVEREPENSDFINDIGVLHLELGRARIAQRYFQKALRLKPSEADYIRNFSTALLLDESLEEVLDEENLKVLGNFLHTRINLDTAEEKGYDVKKIARNLEVLGDIFYDFYFEEERVLFFKCNIAAQYFDFSEERARRIIEVHKKTRERKQIRSLREIFLSMSRNFEMDSERYARIMRYEQ